MIPNIKLRPSMGPVAKNCASSMWIQDGAPQIIEPSSVFSQCGTALHAVFSDIIYKNGIINEESLQPYSEKYNVDLDGYFGIHWRSNKIKEKWAKVQQYFQDAKREEKISCTLDNGFVLEGTPDLFGVYGEYATVFDLKTGEAEVDYFPQVELYALILWKKYGASGLKKVFCALFSPMLDKFEAREFSAEYLEELEQKYIADMQVAGAQYSPGPWCKYCKRITTCPVMLQTINPSIDMLNTEGREINGSDIGVLRPRIALMKKLIERYESLETALLETFGIIDLGNGYELAFTNYTEKTYEPTATVEYLLSQRVSMENIVASLDFSTAQVKDLAATVAVKRSKTEGVGVTQARFMAEMTKNGTIKETGRKKKVQRPIRASIPQPIQE